MLAPLFFQNKRTENTKEKIGIIITLTDNDGATKFFDKYELLSPELLDSNQVDFHFIDQQRIALPEGNYTLKLSIVDANSDDDPYTYQQEISFWSAKETAFSSIQFVESYQQNDTKSNINKNGIDLNLCQVMCFMKNTTRCTFTPSYIIYQKHQCFSYYIVSAETNQIVGSLASLKFKNPIMKLGFSMVLFL